MTTAERTEPHAEPETVQSILGEIPRGTLVEYGGVEYVWVGLFGGRAEGITEEGSMISLGIPTAESARQVQVRRDHLGQPVMCDPRTKGLIQPILNQRATIKEQRERQAATVSDWETLDKLLKEEAESRGWCEEYDKRIDQWNSMFTRMELTKRSRTYEVEVTVTATYTGTVTVEDCTSESDARYNVDNMEFEEVMDEIGNPDPYPADIDIEGVEVA